MTGFEITLYGVLWVASCFILAALFVAVIVGTYVIVVTTIDELRNKREDSRPSPHHVDSMRAYMSFDAFCKDFARHNEADQPPSK